MQDRLEPLAQEEERQRDDDGEQPGNIPVSRTDGRQARKRRRASAAPPHSMISSSMPRRLFGSSIIASRPPRSTELPS